MPDDKNDDLIKKLTEVAGDLSRIIAVHEHRINQQEKHSENIIATLERRRSEVDNVVKEVYATIRDEIVSLRTSSSEQHKEQNEKIGSIQKTVWMGMGAVSILSWLIPLVMRKFL
jgi:hypothetical protein